MKLPDSPKACFQDILIGIIIAFVSIPISMGYAQVSGLPVKYGLYGSLLIPLLFAFFTTSPRFFFGVDAAPAALIGGMIASLGIANESQSAISFIPAITLLVSVWLFLFFLFHADRVLKFISQPVMGGFITGIGATIILMQTPKLFGGNAGTGEALELLRHVFSQASEDFNAVSFLLGLGTIILVVTGRKFFPKVPMQAILMFLGAGGAYFFKLENFGVKMLPSVEKGLPPFSFPDLTTLYQPHVSDFITNLLLPSASIAVVILSETLLATTNTAAKNNDKINTRHEILAYAVCNLASSISGCCPVNGSVSRTGIASQFGVKSQLMSVSAAVVMLLILLFGTGFIQYLPVPILTGIVISALIGTLEFSLAHKLHSVDKAEFFIFYAAFFAVLLLGTIYGVLTGVLLAALTFIIRQTKPYTDFLGVVPGMKGYYSLTRKGTVAQPIKNVILYKFSGPLFYANIEQFCTEIKDSVRENTKVIVVDSSGIGSIDATGAEKLLELYHYLLQRNIKFFLAGHVSSVNNQLREFGSGELIEKQVVRVRISFAMNQAGVPRPYETEENKSSFQKSYNANTAEFDWAFGTSAETKMQEIAKRLAEELAEEIKSTGTFDEKRLHEKEREYSFGYWDSEQEEEFLDILSMHLDTLHEEGKLEGTGHLGESINEWHKQLEHKIIAKNEDVLRKILLHRKERDMHFKKRHPEAYERIELQREKYFEELMLTDPELAKKLADAIASTEE